MPTRAKAKQEAEPKPEPEAKSFGLSSLFDGGFTPFAEVAQAAAARITAVEATMKNTAAESAEALKTARSLEKQIGDASAASTEVNTRLNQMAEDLEKMYSRVQRLREGQEACENSISKLSKKVAVLVESKERREQRRRRMQSDVEAPVRQEAEYNNTDLYQRVMAHKWQRENGLRAEAMLEELSEVSSTLPPSSVEAQHCTPHRHKMKYAASLATTVREE